MQLVPYWPKLSQSITGSKKDCATDMTEYALLVSCFALLLSAFTFYWTSIRHKKDFFLVRIDNIGEITTTRFALINGGNKDILVTKTMCGFECRDGSQSYPAQRIELDEGNSFLIHAGKAIHCKVNFVEPFSSSFVQQGKEENHGPLTLYVMNTVIDVEWILPNGEDYKKSVKIIKYGFDKNGNITMRSPLGKKFDLHV